MKQRYLILFSTAFVLSGCAVTPIGALQSTYADTRGTTPRKFVSRNTTDATTACVIKNIENKIAQFLPTVGPLPDGAKGSELKARSSEAGMAAVIEVRENGTGSAISVWISNHYPFKDALASRIADDC